MSLVPVIIVSCCVLHNFILNKESLCDEDSVDVEEETAAEGNFNFGFYNHAVYVCFHCCNYVVHVCLQCYIFEVCCDLLCVYVCIASCMLCIWIELNV